jgi:transcriptional regulator with XRE-family HTH domain
MASVRAIGASPPFEAYDELDVFVGDRLRSLRLQRGLSVGLLAAAIGASVGEIGEFEAGVTRIGATRLMRLAEALDVHVSAFFELR